MPSGKKRKRAKISTHKRKKRSRANRHKTKKQLTIAQLSTKSKTFFENEIDIVSI